MTAALSGPYASTLNAQDHVVVRVPHRRVDRRGGVGDGLIRDGTKQDAIAATLPAHHPGRRELLAAVPHVDRHPRRAGHQQQLAIQLFLRNLEVPSRAHPVGLEEAGAAYRFGGDDAIVGPGLALSRRSALPWGGAAAWRAAAESGRAGAPAGCADGGGCCGVGFEGALEPPQAARKKARAVAGPWNRMTASACCCM